jgi:hypothetical protein
VRPGNKWGPDLVGWTKKGIAFYRKHKRAPCQWTARQQMVIQSPADVTATRYGAVSLLGGVIGKKTVTSMRAGKKATIRR